MKILQTGVLYVTHFLCLNSLAFMHNKLAHQFTLPKFQRNKPKILVGISIVIYSWTTKASQKKKLKIIISKFSWGLVKWQILHLVHKLSKNRSKRHSYSPSWWEETGQGLRNWSRGHKGMETVLTDLLFLVFSLFSYINQDLLHWGMV